MGNLAADRYVVVFVSGRSIFRDVARDVFTGISEPPAVGPDHHVAAHVAPTRSGRGVRSEDARAPAFHEIVVDENFPWFGGGGEIGDRGAAEVDPIADELVVGDCRAAAVGDVYALVEAFADHRMGDRR